MLNINSFKIGPNTRFTKKGNIYQNSNAARITGTALGATFSIVGYLKNKQIGLKKAAAPAAIAVGIGFVAGAITDFIINKVKAYKADKEDYVGQVIDLFNQAFIGMSQSFLGNSSAHKINEIK